jgi:single-strand DNA-binding protein
MQSSFAKGVKNARPYAAGFRRRAGTQAVAGRTPQAAIEQAPAASLPSPGAQPRAELAGRNRLNEVNVTGRLGRDAVVRHTKNGHVVANFSVAVNESYKDLLGEWRQKTTWYRVQVWEELAETVSGCLLKGARVYVEGRLALRNWVDRENRKHAYREIVARDVCFLDTAPRRKAQNGGEFTAECAPN